MRGRESERAEFSLSLGGHFSVTLDGVKIPVTLRLTAERGRRRRRRRRRAARREEEEQREERLRKGEAGGGDNVSVSLSCQNTTPRTRRNETFTSRFCCQNTQKQPLVVSQGAITAGFHTFHRKYFAKIENQSDARLLFFILNSGGEGRVSSYPGNSIVSPVFAVYRKNEI